MAFLTRSLLPPFELRTNARGCCSSAVDQCGHVAHQTLGCLCAPLKIGGAGFTDCRLYALGQNGLVYRRVMRSECSLGIAACEQFDYETPAKEFRTNNLSHEAQSARETQTKLEIDAIILVRNKHTYLLSTYNDILSRGSITQCR